MYTTDHTKNPSKIAATAAIIADTFSRYCASSPASRRVLAAVAHDKYSAISLTAASSVRVPRSMMICFW